MESRREAGYLTRVVVDTFAEQEYQGACLTSLELASPGIYSQVHQFSH